MPLMHINSGWRYGSTGKLYVGPYARQLAARQGRAIAISKARAAGHHIPRRRARPLLKRRRRK